MLGGSWEVISGAIGPLIWVISIVTLLMTLLITTHEPPSGPVERMVLQDCVTTHPPMFVRRAGKRRKGMRKQQLQQRLTGAQRIVILFSPFAEQE